MYWPQIIKSYIRLGVGHFYRELADTKVYEIEKIIRPRKAYPSGGYGVRTYSWRNLVSVYTENLSVGATPRFSTKKESLLNA